MRTSKHTIAGPSVTDWAKNPEYPGCWVCPTRASANQLMRSAGVALNRFGYGSIYQSWAGVSERQSSPPVIFYTVMITATTGED